MVKSTISNEKNPLVSIVILNWNGLEDTLKCLDSVQKITYKNIETIVIDNGSEGSLEELEKRVSKKLKLIKNSVNRGFAGGEISALPHCKGKYILLLNNDATIHPEAIERALKTFSSDEKIAVVGSRSYSITDDDESSHGFYSYQRIDPITAEVATYKKDDGKAQDTLTVSGSGVLIKRSVIDEIGYFDERFFAYYEETDLFARYLRAGYRIVYDPSFIIWHKDGASTKNKRFMYYYLMLKNQFLYAYKNFDKAYLREFKKTYFQNFRRSLWIYLKDRSKTQGIHKARIRSTIWNMVYLLGTIRSRQDTQSIHPDFSYSSLLITKQPLAITVIIDATKTEPQSAELALRHLLSLHSKPSEVLIVTNTRIKIPSHSHTITIENIIDKNIFDLSARDFGFISSNTDLLLFLDVEKILTADRSNLSNDLTSLYKEMVSNESALAVNKLLISSFKSDLQLTNGADSPLLAVRKADLVNFLDINNHLYSLSDETLGNFINWCVVECKPISRIEASEETTVMLTTPPSHYPILHNKLKWHIKKAVRNLHLSRILTKIRKILKGTSEERPSRTNAKPVPLNTDRETVLSTPIIINTRDRVDPLKEQLEWLASEGHSRIAFVDNDSTYPELIDLFETTPYQVLPLGRNGLHKAPWESFAIRFIAKGAPYIVSDPDVTPTSETPKNFVQHLYKILNKFPLYDKAGGALKIDDLPDYYQMKQSVIDWESRFWDKSLLLAKDIYAADLDTTFALYRGLTDWFLSPSIRVGGKYAMRHEPWYQDLDKPTNDMMYYRTRASRDVSTWTKGKLPKHHIRALKKEGLL